MGLKDGFDGGGRTADFGGAKKVPIDPLLATRMLYLTNVFFTYILKEPNNNLAASPHYLTNVHTSRCGATV